MAVWLQVCGVDGGATIKQPINCQPVYWIRPALCRKALCFVCVNQSHGLSPLSVPRNCNTRPFYTIARIPWISSKCTAPCPNRGTSHSAQSAEQGGCSRRIERLFLRFATRLRCCTQHTQFYFPLRIFHISAIFPPQNGHGSTIPCLVHSPCASRSPSRARLIRLFIGLALQNIYFCGFAAELYRRTNVVCCIL